MANNDLCVGVKYLYSSDTLIDQKLTSTKHQIDHILNRRSDTSEFISRIKDSSIVDTGDFGFLSNLFTCITNFDELIIKSISQSLLSDNKTPVSNNNSECKICTKTCTALDNNTAVKCAKAEASITNRSTRNTPGSRSSLLLKYPHSETSTKSSPLISQSPFMPLKYNRPRAVKNLPHKIVNAGLVNLTVNNNSDIHIVEEHRADENIGFAQMVVGAVADTARSHPYATMAVNTAVGVLLMQTVFPSHFSSTYNSVNSALFGYPTRLYSLLSGVYDIADESSGGTVSHTVEKTSSFFEYILAPIIYVLSFIYNVIISIAYLILDLLYKLDAATNHVVSTTFMYLYMGIFYIIALVIRVWYIIFYNIGNFIALCWSWIVYIFCIMYQLIEWLDFMTGRICARTIDFVLSYFILPIVSTLMIIPVHLTNFVDYATENLISNFLIYTYRYTYLFFMGLFYSFTGLISVVLRGVSNIFMLVSSVFSYTLLSALHVLAIINGITFGLPSLCLKLVYEIISLPFIFVTNVISTLLSLVAYLIEWPTLLVLRQANGLLQHVILPVLYAATEGLPESIPFGIDSWFGYIFQLIWQILCTPSFIVKFMETILGMLSTIIDGGILVESPYFQWICSCCSCTLKQT